jgi:superfamily I DNA/RNA helicase
MKQNINAVQTQTTTDNSTATGSKTKLVGVPTQSQGVIDWIAKNFGYQIELVNSDKECLPCLHYASSNREEAKCLVERISQLTSTGACYSEIAILCQNPTHLTTIAAALNKAGIPFVETHHKVEDQVFRMMKNVLEIIRWLESSYTTARPRRALIELVFAVNQSGEFAGPLFEKISKNGWTEFKTFNSTKDVVANVRTVLMHLAKQKQMTKSSLTLLTNSVLLLLKLSYKDNISSLIIERDLKLITDSLAEYSDWQTMINNFPTFTTEGVELTTHAGKSKQWKNVLLVNVVKGLLPWNNLSMSEEREWFFQAINSHTKSLVIIQNPAAQTAEEKKVQRENPSSYLCTLDGKQPESANKNILWVTGDKYK